MLANLLFMLLASTSAVPVQGANLHLQIVPKARLVHAAREALPTKPSSVRASVIGVPDTMRVPHGALTFRAAKPSGHWPRARVAVPVRIFVDGIARGQATVWFAVTAPTEGWVYRSDMPIGTMVQASDVVAGSFDRARASGALIDQIERLQGMRLKRAVTAGMPLMKGDFEVVPMVDAHTQVEVYLAMGRIRMELKGQALASGHRGDVIPVWVHGASAPVRAKVQSQGVVEVVQ